jgi:tetratricopeptide (TPR) repeat protein
VLEGESRLDDAASLFEQYVTLNNNPDGLEVLSTIRAEIAGGTAAAAHQRLKEFLAVHDFKLAVQADRVRTVAIILESIGQFEHADNLYEQFVALASGPEAMLVRAAYLGRYGRVAEALELCEHARRRGVKTGQLAGICVSLVRTGKLSSEGEHRVEALLKEMLQEQPDASELLLHRASLLDYQQRYDEAESVYSTILAHDQNNTVALNNLAWLLTVRHARGQVALAMINLAIELSGPAPELLGTRSAVRASLGEYRQAISDAQQAVEQLGDGVHYLYLANALFSGGDRSAARDALTRALDLGLSEAQLHPLERPSFQNLIRSLPADTD